jgi:hypothetical protein
MHRTLSAGPRVYVVRLTGSDRPASAKAGRHENGRASHDECGDQAVWVDAERLPQHPGSHGSGGGISLNV